MVKGLVEEIGRLSAENDKLSDELEEMHEKEAGASL